MTDYYSLLGVSPAANAEEVKTADRRQVRRSHPDLVDADAEDLRRAATERTARLNEAYNCLSDPDRRVAYDTARRAGSVSTRPSTGPNLVVSPHTLRCRATPGSIARFTLDVRADRRPRGGGPRVRNSARPADIEFTVTAQGASTAKIEVRLDTSGLQAERFYQLPILVTWGELTGPSTLIVQTMRRQRANPTTRSPHTRTRSPNRRVRDLAMISLGGIVLPLLVTAWSFAPLSEPTPADPFLIGTVCAGVVGVTTWLVASSRLLRKPERWGPLSAVWSHLTRWTGQVVLIGSGLVLAIPMLGFILVVTFGLPFFGFLVMAMIVSSLDSADK